MDAATYPVWLVPVLLGACTLMSGACTALLGTLVKVYLGARDRNAREHAELFRTVLQISGNMLVLLERTGGPAPKPPSESGSDQTASLASPGAC